MVTARAILGCPTARVNLRAALPARFKWHSPSVTELTAGRAGERNRAIEQDVNVGGMCLGCCPSPILSTPSVSLALQGCGASRTQRLCQQLCECPRSLLPATLPAVTPLPPTAAEGTQRGARGHKGEMAEPEPIHPAVSQSWEGRLLGFWLANSNANYFFPEGGFDVAEAWSPCAGQGAAQASQRWWASPCNGACCRNAIITECQAVIQLG